MEDSRDMSGESGMVFREEDREWETWAPEQGGRGGGVRWKTFLSSDLTRSSTMTMGILEVPAGEELKSHRHAQVEIYFILNGEGLVSIDGVPRTVESGSLVYIPSMSIHSCENTGDAALRLTYVFPTDSFREIEYLFD